MDQSRAPPLFVAAFTLVVLEELPIKGFGGRGNQSRLALASGTTTASVSRWMNLESLPSGENMERICVALRLPFDALLRKMADYVLRLEAGETFEEIKQSLKKVSRRARPPISEITRTGAPVVAGKPRIKRRPRQPRRLV